MTFNTSKEKTMIDNLTIGEAKELAKMFGGGASAPAAIKGDGRPVIVRSRDAGVQFGYLEEYSLTGATVTIRNARQMWSWTAAQGGTLLDCATHGVKAGKFSTANDRVIVINACAIIDCTPEAVKTLESAKWA